MYVVLFGRVFKGNSNGSTFTTSRLVDIEKNRDLSWDSQDLTFTKCCLNRMYVASLERHLKCDLNGSTIVNLKRLVLWQYVILSSYYLQMSYMEYVPNCM